MVSKIISRLWDLCALVGMLSTAVFIGLYQSGLFHHLAQRLPNSFILGIFR